jgi:cation transport protein ChaC
MGDFWVFGYGSLMWRPGFAHVETARAQLFGYRRALCIRSHVHRGTMARPGLVLGLDRGGSCAGLAFRVPGDLRDEVIAYLREREQVTQVYKERWLKVQIGRNMRVPALTYVADRTHRQYAGALAIDEAVAAIRDSAGVSGPNPEYVLATVDHLRALGIRDLWLETVAERLRSAPA